jgi:phospholipid/cholesterol/gamma-HCH transport system ATP-binding protein
MTRRHDNINNLNSVNSLIIKNLTKDFGSKQVLVDINLEVKKGESLVILGGSGSGKSVLIKTIASLIFPTSGSIKIDDQEITNLDAKSRDKLMEKFGFLFQGGALFDSLPVWQNVAFRLLHQKKLPKKEAKAIAIEKPRKRKLFRKKKYLLSSFIGPFRSKALEFFTFGGKFGRFLMSRTY